MFLFNKLFGLSVSMKVNPMSFLSFVILIFSSMVSIFSGSWLGMWLGLEVNLLSFLVLMNLESLVVIEPCVKYFIVQSFGSAMLLVSFLCMESFLPDFLSFMLELGLMLKTGLAPFHSWLPSVVNSSSWFVGSLILTWQKLAPFILMGWIFGEVMMLLSIGFLAFVGGVGGLNQHSTRAILSYSSLVHSSWLLSALLSSFSLFIFCWLVYSVSVVLMFWCCSKRGMEFLKSKLNCYVSLCSLLILSGLPPFLGFVYKVMVFLSVNSVILFACVLGSLISLKYYISFLFSLVFGSPYFELTAVSQSFYLCFVVIYLNFLGSLLLLFLFCG
uniref:NADH-ubiquinone oxidoreductase chain 2 n=1 Tax=Perumytilus purpuratus TaxID=390823 RepID=A0A346KKY7_PERPP|nr:NADH dehydrogenase subunit 2 [Perumytilus purpuratus]AXP84505.1 NADH dehydrogenase subunit 2 [Perumytilus purpuratus]